MEAKGEILELKRTVNTMVDQLSSFADEVTRVAREVGTQGELGGQAEVKGVLGTWRDLTENVNFMAANLTSQVRNIAQVATAVAQGDLSQKITVDAQGEILELKDTINTMVDQLSSFAAEVTRVAKEVGTEGKLGGQAEVEDVSGTWRGLTENVNLMAANLTGQVRNIAQVTTAVAQGDLSQKISVDARGEIAELKDTVNTMVDQLRSFAAEVTRVAREVGTEGKLGGQAQVEGVSGTSRGLTENVNSMAANLTTQVRNIAQVTTAVANGDLTRKITVDAQGEILELKDTINTMVDQLSSFADEVTRVAREVGTQGELGGQAEVKGVLGTWRDLTENVNFMAANLTSQVRNIAQVATAVAQGDLSQKITVDAQGEILELKDTINTMVDQLSSFAAEVTRVAKEVGTEGKLGGQAEVEDVSGTWRGLTENVNQLASNLTTQVRAIGEVSTAVTQGDLTCQITVEANGEVAELKDNVNQMIDNLRETTRRNAEQDWLNTNLARISNTLQGERDLQTVSRLLMSEISPLVGAQHGAFFLVHEQDEGGPRELRLVASYGYQRRKTLSNRFAFGEGLPGQAALEGKSTLVTGAPGDYVKVVSGLGESAPVNLIVLPILFEDQSLAVMELAWLQDYSEVNLSFLEQLSETIGVVLSTIIANRRTEERLEESQRLTEELQSRSEELQSQQEELRRSNSELEDQAQSLKASEELLQTQQEELRQTNDELQEKAAQLSQQNPGHRAEEHGDRARPGDARGARGPALALVEVQVGVPGQHEPRAAHAPELAAHPVEAPGRQPRGQPHGQAGRVRPDDHLGRVGPPRAHLRHPRPLEGRGGQDGGQPRPRRPGRRARRSGADLPRDRRAAGARLPARARGGRPRGGRHRRPAPAPGSAQPRLERDQVHRGRRGAGPGGRPRRRRSPRRGHRSEGHGDRHPPRQAAARLRGLPAGRRHDEQALRRHGPRPVDQPGDRPAPRRGGRGPRAAGPPSRSSGWPPTGGTTSRRGGATTCAPTTSWTATGLGSTPRCSRERCSPSTNTDGPFNEFHLVVCRNVMIYFGRPLQDRVLRLFDDSLAPLGLLGLGRKETLAGSAVEDHFQALVAEERIFRRRS